MSPDQSTLSLDAELHIDTSLLPIAVEDIPLPPETGETLIVRDEKRNLASNMDHLKDSFPRMTPPMTPLPPPPPLPPLLAKLLASDFPSNQGGYQQNFTFSPSQTLPPSLEFPSVSDNGINCLTPSHVLTVIPMSFTSTTYKTSPPSSQQSILLPLTELNPSFATNAPASADRRNETFTVEKPAAWRTVTLKIMKPNCVKSPTALNQPEHFFKDVSADSTRVELTEHAIEMDTVKPLTEESVDYSSAAGATTSASDPSHAELTKQPIKIECDKRLNGLSAESNQCAAGSINKPNVLLFGRDSQQNSNILTSYTILQLT